MKMGAKVWIGLAIAIFVLAMGGALYAASKPSKLLPLAQCLKEKGVVFYGAFWCPHCQAQKKVFGTAAAELPYVECSTPDGRGQLKQCTDLGVENYPTWVFPDGTRTTGELTAAQLSQASGCPLPQ